MQLVFKVLSHSMFVSCGVSSRENSVFDWLKQIFGHHGNCTSSTAAQSVKKNCQMKCRFGYHWHRNDISMNDCRAVFLVPSVVNEKYCVNSFAEVCLAWDCCCYKDGCKQFSYGDGTKLPSLPVHRPASDVQQRSQRGRLHAPADPTSGHEYRRWNCLNLFHQDPNLVGSPLTIFQPSLTVHLCSVIHLNCSIWPAKTCMQSCQWFLWNWPCYEAMQTVRMDISDVRLLLLCFSSKQMIL